MERSPNVTGEMEISIVGGKLIHSKKNGDGWVDNEEKEQKLISEIESYLSS